MFPQLVPYGTLSLTETSPAQSFTEVFESTDLQTYLNMPVGPFADVSEEEQMRVFILAARAEAEILQSRDLVRKSWDLALDYWPNCNGSIELRPELVSVELVQYRDSAGTWTPLVEGVDYVVDTSKRPGIIAPAASCQWPAFTPWPSSAILIRFTAGLTNASAWWSGAGASVKIGMKYLISQWFNKRLPFETGAAQADPFTLACLSRGAVRNVR